MGIKVVAGVAALDPEVAEILTGLDLHARWQFSLKLGDDDCLVVRLVVELHRSQCLRNDFRLCHKPATLPNTGGAFPIPSLTYTAQPPPRAAVLLADRRSEGEGGRNQFRRTGECVGVRPRRDGGAHPR
jgi:hypothetical protein